MVRRQPIYPVVSDEMVHQIRKPDDIMLVVAGGPEPYHTTFGDS